VQSGQVHIVNAESGYVRALKEDHFSAITMHSNVDAYNVTIA